MNSPNESNIPQDLHITLELISEDVSELDQAVTNAVGREAVTALQRDGYLVKLVDTPTKTRGGELLIEITKAVINLATNAWQHKEVFERVLNDSAALVQIMTVVVPVMQSMLQPYKKHARQESGPIKLTTEIDGKAITVEAPDLEQADAALQLAQKYASHHPAIAARVTPRSKVKVKGTVPGQRRRKKK